MSFILRPIRTSFVHVKMCELLIESHAVCMLNAWSFLRVFCIFFGTRELTNEKKKKQHENFLIYWHLHMNRVRKSLLNVGKMSENIRSHRSNCCNILVLSSGFWVFSSTTLDPLSLSATSVCAQLYIERVLCRSFICKVEKKLQPENYINEMLLIK